jgi:ATP-dependent RNA helicase DOB1
MRRLEELLRQLMVASKSIGNAPLEQKFSAAIVAIKRDVIFMSSLYV